MHSGIRVSAEGRRGCGYRKKGGLYVVAGGPSAPCGRIPIPLDRCPTCDHGIKPTRGWTWIDVAGLLRDAPPCRSACAKVKARMECEAHGYPFSEALHADDGRTCGDGCAGCPLRDGTTVGRAGLLWVQQGYPTPEAFLQEAGAAGISRRIVAVPKGFKTGETWVLLAHRKAVSAPCDCTAGQQSEPPGLAVNDLGLFCDACGGSGQVKAPGIFSAFVPEAIEAIVDGTESDEEIDALLERGLSPVKVEQVDGPAVGRPGSWADHVERAL